MCNRDENCTRNAAWERMSASSARELASQAQRDLDEGLVFDRAAITARVEAFLAEAREHDARARECTCGAGEES